VTDPDEPIHNLVPFYFMVPPRYLSISPSRFLGGEAAANGGLTRQTTPRNTRLCDETALFDGLEDEACTMIAER
jgi:hypothetical protein